MSCGGLGSLPGTMVSLLRILRAPPCGVSSPSPWFCNIPFAACTASFCVLCRLDAFSASLRLFSHVPSGRRETVRSLPLLIFDLLFLLGFLTFGSHPYVVILTQVRSVPCRAPYPW